MTHHELVLLGRAALAFALCYVIGFERELRGSPAGDRTYALVGLAAAAITSVAELRSPQAIAGVVTGIGFIGGGLVFRQADHTIRGITSAATIFASAAIGIVSGTGHWLLSILVAALVLLDLELRNVPGLRRLDARRYVERVRDDMAVPIGMDPEVPPPDGGAGGGSAPSR